MRVRGEGVSILAGFTGWDVKMHLGPGEDQCGLVWWEMWPCLRSIHGLSGPVQPSSCEAFGRCSLQERLLW